MAASNLLSDSLKVIPSREIPKTRCWTENAKLELNPQAGPYVWLTYREAYDAALQMGSAMRSRGVNPGERCGIYGSNCPEWIIAMEACNSQAIPYVPLYDSLGANAVEFIINHAEVSIAFVQESKIPAMLTCLPKCTSYLKRDELNCLISYLCCSAIISFGKISSSQKEEAEELGVSCFSWEEFALLGSLDCELPPKQKTDICTIMYTSGTTGEPKGVVYPMRLSWQKFSKDITCLLAVFQATEEDTYFSFLPLAHVFDQIMETYCIYKGSSIGFWGADVRYLMEDIQELKPTIFCGVPRVYERIYGGAIAKISSGGALRKALFQYAYNYKLRNLEKGLRQDEAAPRLDRLIFDKIKQGFGGRVRLLFSGAAPLSRHVEDLTESSGGCLTSIVNEFSMMGTVGVPFPTIEARLESVPEMGYDALSNVPRGEICLRGKTLFSGYFKRQDLTESALVDGWFHTGDIGEWQPNGAMKIIDRKKNIFKLSQGEYVAVENLENTYSRCPLITSIWVYGNSFESFLVAVVVPDKKALEDWAENHNVTGDFKSLCENLEARKYILDELNNTGQNHQNSAQLKGFERLKAIHLDPNPFDIERDLVTPTFKLKRPQLLKYYKDIIDRLYSEAKGTKS
ncbi:Long chain acyl-CoA synthetase 2 [Vitis vinifera]|uniref:Long-chain-fatty-acid--CoA ligase n=1 Tax=Vitis vinifera TaxID=29760 RepID=A0A438EL53_VITVI|nr:Long chain acyl-CoA synthetase 2 [Vitis vinifera]